MLIISLCSILKESKFFKIDNFILMHQIIKNIWKNIQRTTKSFFPKKYIFTFYEWKLDIAHKFLGSSAVTWMKYCRYGVKLYPINQWFDHILCPSDGTLNGAPYQGYPPPPTLARKRPFHWIVNFRWKVGSWGPPGKIQNCRRRYMAEILPIWRTINLSN